MMTDDITKQDDAWATLLGSASPPFPRTVTRFVSFCSSRQEEIAEESDTHSDWLEAEGSHLLGLGVRCHILYRQESHPRQPDLARHLDVCGLTETAEPVVPEATQRGVRHICESPRRRLE